MKRETGEVGNKREGVKEDKRDGRTGNGTTRLIRSTDGRGVWGREVK